MARGSGRWRLGVRSVIDRRLAWVALALGVACEPTSSSERAERGSGDTAAASPGSWDAAPPPHEVGTVLTTAVSCALLEGDPSMVWRQGIDRWDAIGELPALRADLIDCFRPDELWLSWDAVPSIHIRAAGLDHHLHPAVTEGFWVGEVAPVGGSTVACDAALAAAGLGWPVTMGLQVESVQPP